MNARKTARNIESKRLAKQNQLNSAQRRKMQSAEYLKKRRNRLITQFAAELVRNKPSRDKVLSLKRRFYASPGMRKYKNSS